MLCMVEVTHSYKNKRVRIKCIRDHILTELSHILTEHPVNPYLKWGQSMPLQHNGWACTGEVTADKLRTAFSAGQWTEALTQSDGSLAHFPLLLSFSLALLVQIRGVYLRLYGVKWISVALNAGDGFIRGRVRVVITFTGSVSCEECSPTACFCRCSCITQIQREKDQQAAAVRGSIPAPPQLVTPTGEQSGPARSRWPWGEGCVFG